VSSSTARTLSAGRAEFFAPPQLTQDNDAQACLIELAHALVRRGIILDRRRHCFGRFFAERAKDACETLVPRRGLSG
jgi:hypothetical protein